MDYFYIQSLCFSVTTTHLPLWVCGLQSEKPVPHPVPESREFKWQHVTAESTVLHENTAATANVHPGISCLHFVFVFIFITSVLAYDGLSQLMAAGGAVSHRRQEIVAHIPCGSWKCMLLQVWPQPCLWNVGSKLKVCENADICWKRHHNTLRSEGKKHEIFWATTI